MVWNKKDSRQSTDQLVAVAKIAAVSSLLPLLDAVPPLASLLKGSHSDGWDFFATVTAVGAGMYDAYQSTPELEIAVTEKALRESLTTWDRQGYDAYQDFGTFVARQAEGGIDFPAAVGAWLLWNLKSGAPTSQELAVAPTLGIMLCGTMARSWG